MLKVILQTCDDKRQMAKEIRTRAFFFNPSKSRSLNEVTDV